MLHKIVIITHRHLHAAIVHGRTLEVHALSSEIALVFEEKGLDIWELIHLIELVAHSTQVVPH